MRNSNITRVDSKGRILIPNHIRKDMGADEGIEVVIIPDGDKGQARIFPLVKEKTAKFKFLISDSPGSLATIADTMSHYNINIIMSESRTLSKGKMAEWDVIADISECDGNLVKMKDVLLKMNTIKNMEIVRE